MGYGPGVYPNLSEIESAGRTVKYVHPRGDISRAASGMTALKQRISFVLGLGQQIGSNLDFAALPPSVLRASKATFSRFASSR